MCVCKVLLMYLHCCLHTVSMTQSHRCLTLVKCVQKSFKPVSVRDTGQFKAAVVLSLIRQALDWLLLKPLCTVFYYCECVRQMCCCHQCWPVGEVSRHLHHLSDGVRVGTSHGADVQAGVTLFLHLFKKTEKYKINKDDGGVLSSSWVSLWVSKPQRSSSGRCCSGG